MRLGRVGVLGEGSVVSHVGEVWEYTPARQDYTMPELMQYYLVIEDGDGVLTRTKVFNLETGETGWVSCHAFAGGSRCWKRFV